jgi:hypothetical protein
MIPEELNIKYITLLLAGKLETENLAKAGNVTDVGPDNCASNINTNAYITSLLQEPEPEPVRVHDGLQV